MYRLVLYGLGSIALWAFCLAAIHRLAYQPGILLLSLIVLLVTAMSVNALLSRLFHVTSNIESAAITALILFCIFVPASTLHQAIGLALAATIAIGLKFVLVRYRTHMINPAAFAAVVVGTITGTAQWWIATSAMFPIVCVVGLLIMIKVRRIDMVLIFGLTALVGKIVVLPLLIGQSVGDLLAITKTIAHTLISWPIIFFSTIMLTEPMTTPPTRNLRRLYAFVTGILFVTPLTIGPLAMTPELSLVLSNLIGSFWQPHRRFNIKLLDRTPLTDTIHEFQFEKPATLAFTPGQYMEWTVPGSGADARGNRRYFSLASSPLETTLRVVLRVPTNSSTYKQSLLSMKVGDTIVASHAAGDFTLPANPETKIVLLAGGVGITPFISMIRHLLATNERRDIVLLYVARTANDLIYQPLFQEAATVGVSTVYLPSDQISITDDLLQAHVPNYDQRTWYLSGPTGMIQTYEQLLRNLRIPRSRIHTDYFTGY